MLSCGVLNAAIEFVAYRPLRSAPRLAPLITAIGVSFIIEDVGLAWKGPNYVSAPDVFPRTKVFSIAGVDYSWNKLIVVLITIPVLLGLLYLVQQTRQGKAMRATAQDKDAAAIMGINVNRTISFTFLIAGALAGAAGLLYSLYVTTVRFDQGFQLGLIAFTAAVLGGIGNLPGAVLGAVLIGLHPGVQRGAQLACAGLGLDAVDRLLDPDPDPRLPARGTARRTHAGGRVSTQPGTGTARDRGGRLAQPAACTLAGAAGRAARRRSRSGSPSGLAPALFFRSTTRSATRSRRSPRSTGCGGCRFYPRVARRESC